MDALHPRLLVSRFTDCFRFYDAVLTAPIGATRAIGSESGPYAHWDADGQGCWCSSTAVRWRPSPGPRACRARHRPPRTVRCSSAGSPMSMPGWRTVWNTALHRSPVRAADRAGAPRSAPHMCAIPRATSSSCSRTERPRRRLSAPGREHGPGTDKSADKHRWRLCTCAVQNRFSAYRRRDDLTLCPSVLRRSTR